MGCFHNCNPLSRYTGSCTGIFKHSQDIRLLHNSRISIFDRGYILYVYNCKKESEENRRDCQKYSYKEKMNLHLLLEVRKFLIYSKMWIQRTMSWIAVVNSGMILFLVLSRLQDYGIKIHITAWFIPIYLGVILLMMLFGYIEDRAGLFREESRVAAARNPYFKDIIDRLDRIEKRLKK